MELKVEINWNDLLNRIVEDSNKDDIHLLFNHLLHHCRHKFGDEAVRSEEVWMHLQDFFYNKHGE